MYDKEEEVLRNDALFVLNEKKKSIILRLFLLLFL